MCSSIINVSTNTEPYAEDHQRVKFSDLRPGCLRISDHQSSPQTDSLPGLGAFAPLLG